MKFKLISYCKVGVPDKGAGLCGADVMKPCCNEPALAWFDFGSFSGAIFLEPSICLLMVCDGVDFAVEYLEVINGVCE
jgi:hypothetical protein